MFEESEESWKGVSRVKHLDLVKSSRGSGVRNRYPRVSITPRNCSGIGDEMICGKLFKVM